ncbi:MAG: hypothetical protein G01um10143_757 [Parcubacteria group bacterium Gr01-1014_3]|nr:MAG: hypothetical protein G01um10143_757 [Parcubacteria group bacterium Gr01-1014_3]
MGWDWSESLWWLMWGYTTNFFLMAVYLIGFDYKQQDELAKRVGFGLECRWDNQTGSTLQAAIMSLFWFLIVMDIKKIWPFNENTKEQ